MYHMTETKLPKGWSRGIPDHNTKIGTKRLRSATYQSWYNMICRCYYQGSHPDNAFYYKGILVYEKWIDFQEFLQDMGPRPAGHTLDRIDSLGHYEPGNCRWSTPVEQTRNRKKRHDNQ
jgi:hypothetical protein